MSTRVEDVTMRLREMIVSGRVRPGARVGEREIAELLGVSRTPVQVALGIVEVEGLVEGAPNKGFTVRSFGIDEVLSAYDVRSALEALAVSTAMQRGLTDDTTATLDACLAECDVLVGHGSLGPEEMRRWSIANARFHGAVLDAAGLPALTKVSADIARMPLAAPIAILFTDSKLDVAYAKMVEAHGCHVRIVAAMRRGETERAASLMREHVLRSRDNLRIVLIEKMQPGETAAPTTAVRLH